MDDPPDHPMRSMSKEQFEALLIEVRNGVSASQSRFLMERVAGGEENEATVEDLRAVWHAAEVALAVLNLGVYAPKREALSDMRYILNWLDALEEPDSDD